MSPDQTKLEAETREAIDAKLEAAGWVIQNKKKLNLFESLGVAVREMDTDTGPADDPEPMTPQFIAPRVDLG